MSYNRETWEKVSFQVFEDEGGAIRSGYYPTGDGLTTGNVAIDYAYGNFPIQPNEDRTFYSLLGAGDSHKIAAVEWDSYPTVGATANAANYMITKLEFLGGTTYEFTAQNNLKVGDVVRISNLSFWEDFNATVTYATATTFRFEDEKGEPPVLTGLYGRADVIYGTNGHTLEGGEAFYWPELWFCSSLYNNRKVSDVINEMVSYGVPRSYFVDFTFSGGSNEWDSNGEPNWNGAILYTYIPADVSVGTDWLGQPIYGSAFDGVVLGANRNGGYEDSVDSGYPEDYMLLVASNDPRKNNAGWWFN